MKKTIFVMGLIGFLLTGGIAYGETILTMPCANGGNITVDSSGFSYSPVTGNYSILFQFNDCAEGNVTYSGSISSNGRFWYVSNNMADILINNTINMTVSDAINGGQITANNCTGKYEGSYELNTQKFTGQFNINCSGSVNNMMIDIVKLLMGPAPDF